MPKVRALIVDDEPLARRGIRQLLLPYSDIEVVGECRDGREALRALSTAQSDLVFLDIQMPGMDGLSVIRIHGAEHMPVTVFVTAYDEFAVRAFAAHALDYLVKPVSESRFRATMTRVREQLRMKDAFELAGRLAELLQGEPTGRSPAASFQPPATGGPLISVHTETGERLLYAGEIDWIEARDYYVDIHLGTKQYRAREPLSSLESRLDAAMFMRVHRSIIVRLDRVLEWRAEPSESRTVVVLRDGTELPVSRRRLPRLKSLLRPPSHRHHNAS